MFFSLLLGLFRPGEDDGRSTPLSDCEDSNREYTSKNLDLLNQDVSQLKKLYQFNVENVKVRIIICNRFAYTKKSFMHKETYIRCFNSELLKSAGPSVKFYLGV